MKTTLIQLGLVVGSALVVGLLYNLATASTDNHLALTVPEGRYKNALNCPKPAVAAAGQPVSGQPVSGQPVSGQPVSGEPVASGTQVEDPVKASAGEPATSEPVKEAPGPGTSEPGDTSSPGTTPRILVDEAFDEWESGTLFIDARRKKEYVKGHIPGAISISPWEKGREEKVSRLAESEPHEAPVVVYCTRSKDCEDSEEISSNLKQVGFENVLVFQGGFPVWQDEKKPVAKGEEPGDRP